MMVLYAQLLARKSLMLGIRPAMYYCWLNKRSDNIVFLYRPYVTASNKSHHRPISVRQVISKLNSTGLVKLLYSDQFKLNMTRKPELLPFYCENLVQRRYSEHENNLPYELTQKRNTLDAFKQLELSPLRDEYLNVPPALKELTKDVIPSLDIKSKSIVLLMLVYLGLNKCDALLRGVYSEAKASFDNDVYLALNLLSLCDAIGIQDNELLRKILIFVSDEFASGEPASDHMTSYAFLKLLPLMPPLFSSDLCEKIGNQLNILVADNKFMLHNPKVVHNWCAAMSSIYQQSDLETQLVLEKASLKLHEYLWSASSAKHRHTLDSIHDIETHTSWRRTGLYSQFIGVPSIVDGNTCYLLSLNQLLIAAAYCATDTIANTKLCHCIRLALLNQLTTNISCLEPYFAFVDHKLVGMILGQQMIPGQLRAHLIQLHLSGVLQADLAQSELNILPQRTWDEELREQVLHEAVDLLDVTISQDRICVVLATAIANANALTTNMVNYIKSTLPGKNLTLEHIVLLLRAIQSQCQSRLFKGQNQGQDHSPANKLTHQLVQTALHIIARINTAAADDTRIVSEFRHNYFNLFQVLDPHTQNLSERRALAAAMFAGLERVQHLSTVPGSVFNGIVRLILTTSYFSPIILDRLVDAALATTAADDTLTASVTSHMYGDHAVMNALRVCAMFTYRPASFDVLLERCEALYQRAMKHQQYDFLLNILISYSFLNHFPGAHLQHFFSEEVYPHLLEFISQRNNKHELLLQLSSLNESVSKLCPQLNIAEVAELRKYALLDRSPQANRFITELHECLANICGGAGYVRYISGDSRVRAEFEIVVDDELSLPVPVSDWNAHSHSTDNPTQQQQQQRIAVMTYSRWAFAINTPRLLCQYDIRCRVLRSQGYQVVKVVRPSGSKNSERMAAALQHAILDCKNRDDLPLIMCE